MMLCLRILPIAALLAIALAQVDLGKVAGESPACVVSIKFSPFDFNEYC
jgi:hypothetical protein